MPKKRFDPDEFKVMDSDGGLAVESDREFRGDKGTRLFRRGSDFRADTDLDRMAEAEAEPMGQPPMRERITPDRTDHFDLETGQFRDPETGTFEPGGPPPDYDAAADRFRAVDGQFKSRTADHFDEPAEVRLDSLDPMG